ncbi:MAG: pentapeptide repeat-containing protein [Thermoflexales bacterium]|nr:pentapeptide repeat-containing protein [Thermoflexales bacterium]
MTSADGENQANLPPISPNNVPSPTESPSGDAATIIVGQINNPPSDPIQQTNAQGEDQSSLAPGPQNDAPQTSESLPSSETDGGQQITADTVTINDEVVERHKVTQHIFQLILAGRESGKVSSFIQVNFGKVTLTDLMLAGISFRQANLTESHIERVDFTEADLFGAVLKSVTLNAVDLDSSDLRLADLSDAKLTNSKLRQAKLFQANGRRAIFSGVNLRDADLREAQMQGAIFSDTDLSNAHLEGADFTGATFPNTAFVGATKDDYTKFDPFPLNLWELANLPIPQVPQSGHAAARSEPTTSTSSRSGGANLEGEQIHVKGDVSGRDKFILNLTQQLAKNSSSDLTEEALLKYLTASVIGDSIRDAATAIARRINNPPSDPIQQTNAQGEDQSSLAPDPQNDAPQTSESLPSCEADDDQQTPATADIVAINGEAVERYKVTQHIFQLILAGRESGKVPSFIQVNFGKVTLTDLMLAGISFRQANLTESRIERVDLGRADLFSAILKGAKFDGVNLNSADLRFADLTDAQLTNSNLRQAKLFQTNGRETVFKGVDLRDADLREAQMQGAIFSDTDLSNARLEGADFTGARFPDTILVGATKDAQTRLDPIPLSLWERANPPTQQASQSVQAGEVAAQKNNTSPRSGGVDVEAKQIHVDGDITGNDKYISNLILNLTQQLSKNSSLDPAQEALLKYLTASVIGASIRDAATAIAKDPIKQHIAKNDLPLIDDFIRESLPLVTEYLKAKITSQTPLPLDDETKKTPTLHSFSLPESIEDFSRQDFSKSDLTARSFVRAHLPHANLSNVKGQKVSFKQANLEGTNLSAAQLEGAVFKYAYLGGADLRGAQLQDADLSDANLTNAKLSSVNLTRANLSHTILREANLQNADLHDANLSGADFSRANLRNAQHLTQAQLDSAKSLSGAIMPDGKIHP